MCVYSRLPMWYWINLVYLPWERLFHPNLSIPQLPLVICVSFWHFFLMTIYSFVPRASILKQQSLSVDFALLFFHSEVVTHFRSVSNLVSPTCSVKSKSQIHTQTHSYFLDILGIPRCHLRKEVAKWQRITSVTQFACVQMLTGPHTSYDFNLPLVPIFLGNICKVR